MRVCMVGTGYVGLVVAASVADWGHDVACIDENVDKIRCLSRGMLPFFEPGLAPVVQRGLASGRLTFPTAVSVAGTDDLVIICVGTPNQDDEDTDLSAVEAVVDELGEVLPDVVPLVIKSTVPVGTADRLSARLRERTGLAFDVVSNPEFLAEGTALSDFNQAARVVIGCRVPEAGDVLERLYEPIVAQSEVVRTDNRSAELSKYASNAMLAIRVSFINEVAGLCDAVEADIDMVAAVMGADPRIGELYLEAGCGYGGSCLSKDARSLALQGRRADVPMRLVEVAEAANIHQQGVLARKLTEVVGEDWSSLRIALWGLAFKPDTDDVRHAPALVFVKEAVARGGQVVAFDPRAGESAHAQVDPSVRIVRSALSALDDADVLVVATDWRDFALVDIEDVARRMRGRIVVDGRNILDWRTLVQRGFRYLGIGRGTARAPTRSGCPS